MRQHTIKMLMHASAIACVLAMFCAFVLQLILSQGGRVWLSLCEFLVTTLLLNVTPVVVFVFMFIYRNEHDFLDYISHNKIHLLIASGIVLVCFLIGIMSTLHDLLYHYL